MSKRPYIFLFLPLLVILVLVVVLLLLPSPPPARVTIRYDIPDGTVLAYEVSSLVEQERIRSDTHDRSRTEAGTLILFGYYTHKDAPKAVIMFHQQSSKILKFLRNERDITDALRGSGKEEFIPEFFFLDRPEERPLHIRINRVDTGNIILALQCKRPPLGETRAERPFTGEQDFGALKAFYKWRLTECVKRDDEETAVFSSSTLFEDGDGKKLGLLQARVSVDTKTSVITEEKGELLVNIEEVHPSGEREKVIYRREYSSRLLKKDRLDSEKLAKQMDELEKSYIAQVKDRPLDVLEHLRRALEAYQDSPFTPYIASRLNAALKRVQELHEELLSEELEKQLKKLLTCPHCGKIHGPGEHKNHKEK